MGRHPPLPGWTGLRAVTMWSKNQFMREDGEDEGKPNRGGNAPGDGGERDAKGRLVGRTKLTARQALYVAELGNGKAQAEAARMAGYASGAVAASEANRSVGVRTLIDRRRRRIIDQCAGYAVLVLRDTVTGKYKPDRIQWEATQRALAMAGLDKPEGSEKASDNKPIHQMSLKELEAMAARIQSAKRVSVVPELDADAVQVIEKTGEDTP